MDQQDIVVIGGGAGGLVVASGAAQLGRRVTLIEKAEHLGGDCLHTGCVPSKTLIHSAKVAWQMRQAKAWGLQAVAQAVDLGRVMDHVQAVIAEIQVHDDPARFRDYGIDVVFGHAHFIDAHTVQVGERQITGRRFVIATGTRPRIPVIQGLETVGYVTNETIFELRDLPERLTVIGEGPIGVEMAQAFARLGSQVTIIGRAAHVLPREDSEVAERLQAVLLGEGVRYEQVVSTDRVSKVATGKRLQFTAQDGKKHNLDADEILVAAGRLPNVEGLGLESASVNFNERGIIVDKRLRTTRRHIYACGDVAGPYQFTHMAEYQAGVVIGNAVFRVPKKVDYRVVPWVTYTDPELAHVGLTEAAARRQGLNPQVLRYEFKNVDRAITSGETAGLVKMVTDRGKILGASILGPSAGELIHEIALAMKSGANIGDISSTIHAYPTLAQVHRRTVNTYYGEKLFSPATKTLVKWMNRIVP